MQTSCATAFSAAALVVIWIGLRHVQQRAFWSLLLVGFFYQAMWLLADPLVGSRIIVFNIASSIVFVIGSPVAGYGLFRG